MQVTWITSLRELNNRSKSYEALVRRAGDDGLFYRIDYLERAAPMFLPAGSSLAFLWFERNGSPVAVAPFQISTKDWMHGRLRRLHFIGTGVGGPMANGVPGFLIPNPDDREAVLEALAKELRQRREAWDLMDLNGIPAGSIERDMLRGLLESMAESDEPMMVPLVRLEDGFDSYRSGISDRLNRALGKAGRRLAASGLTHEYEVSTRLTPERFRQCAGLHTRRQALLQEKNEGRVARYSVFEDPVQGPVWKSLLEWTADAGHARHYFMDIDGKLASFLLCFHNGATFYPILTAIDDQFEYYKPGYLVHLFAFEQETQHGTRIVNQLPGTNLMKELLSNDFVKRIRIEWRNRYHVLSRARCGWLDLGHRIREWRSRPAA